MKKRNGFVSNSSSSSFVVAFKKTPSDAEEMRKTLFGEKERYFDPWDYDACWATEHIAKIVYDDIKEPLSKKQILREIKHGYFPGYPEEKRHWWYISDKEEQEKERKAYYQRVDDAANGLAEKFYADNKDCEIFEFEYSDNEGSMYSAMEHGDLFKQLPHIKISKH
jgi:hypothetical protein